MSEQDDDKKIIDGENPSSDNENQPSVDDNNQPEGVENQKNDTSQEEEENNQSLTQENQSNDQNLETSSSENENNNQNKDNKKKPDVKTVKDGRLHIYVRQDKYKGELKSKNWVGRLYIDGKQKISSSGTTNLEEAIPILEKWFDEVHEESEKLKKQSEEAQNIQSQTKTEEVQIQNTPLESIESTPTQTPEVNQTNETQSQPVTPAVSLNESTETQNQDEPKSKLSNIFGKLKEIKLKKPSFAKNLPKPSLSSFNKNKIGGFKSKFEPGRNSWVIRT